MSYDVPCIQKHIILPLKRHQILHLNAGSLMVWLRAGIFIFALTVYRVYNESIRNPLFFCVLFLVSQYPYREEACL